MSALLAFILSRLAGGALAPVAKLLRLLVSAAGGRRIVAPASRASGRTRRALVGARRDVVLAEIAESRLTRSWRPALMFLLMGFLLFLGLVIPSIEMVTGRTFTFEPRFELLPDAVWNLLAIGLGGYIGGRSAEKIAGRMWVRPSPRRRRMQSPRSRWKK
jgi:hypothetical protein